MPVARTVCWSPTLPSREAALGTVSVVMMARAASFQKAGCILGRAAMILSAGSGSRITPVEKGSTWFGLQPICRAAAAHCQSIDSALCARTRVGVARVDDEGAHAVFVEKVRFGDVDGRGTETVGREDCTDGAGGYGNQCQVGMPGLLHACLGGVEGNAVDVGQLFGGFSVRLTAITVLLASVSAFRRHGLKCRLKRVQNPKTGISSGAISAVSTPLNVSPSPRMPPCGGCVRARRQCPSRAKPCRATYPRTRA